MRIGLLIHAVETIGRKFDANESRDLVLARNVFGLTLQQINLIKELFKDIQTLRPTLAGKQLDERDKENLGVVRDRIDASLNPKSTVKSDIERKSQTVVDTEKGELLELRRLIKEFRLTKGKYVEEEQLLEKAAEELTTEMEELVNYAESIKGAYDFIEQQGESVGGSVNAMKIALQGITDTTKKFNFIMFQMMGNLFPALIDLYHLLLKLFEHTRQGEEIITPLGTSNPFLELFKPMTPYWPTAGIGERFRGTYKDGLHYLLGRPGEGSYAKYLIEDGPCARHVIAQIDEKLKKAEEYKDLAEKYQRYLIQQTVIVKRIKEQIEKIKATEDEEVKKAAALAKGIEGRLKAQPPETMDLGFGNLLQQEGRKLKESPWSKFVTSRIKEGDRLIKIGQELNQVNQDMIKARITLLDEILLLFRELKPSSYNWVWGLFEDKVKEGRVIIGMTDAVQGAIDRDINDMRQRRDLLTDAEKEVLKVLTDKEGGINRGRMSELRVLLGKLKESGKRTPQPGSRTPPRFPTKTRGSYGGGKKQTAYSYSEGRERRV